MITIEEIRGRYPRELMVGLVIILVALASLAIGYRLGKSEERTPIIIEQDVGEM